MPLQIAGQLIDDIQASVDVIQGEIEILEIGRGTVEGRFLGMGIQDPGEDQELQGVGDTVFRLPTRSQGLETFGNLELVEDIVQIEIANVFVSGGRRCVRFPIQDGVEVDVLRNGAEIRLEFLVGLRNQFTAIGLGIVVESQKLGMLAEGLDVDAGHLAVFPDGTGEVVDDVGLGYGSVEFHGGWPFGDIISYNATRYYN